LAKVAYIGVGNMGQAKILRLLGAIAILPDDLKNLAAVESQRLAPALTGGPVYTDDNAPVEWLVDKSILGYAGDR